MSRIKCFRFDSDWLVFQLEREKLKSVCNLYYIYLILKQGTKSLFWIVNRFQTRNVNKLLGIFTAVHTASENHCSRSLSISYIFSSFYTPSFFYTQFYSSFRLQTPRIHHSWAAKRSLLFKLTKICNSFQCSVRVPATMLLSRYTTVEKAVIYFFTFVTSAGKTTKLYAMDHLVALPTDCQQLLKK